MRFRLLLPLLVVAAGIALFWYVSLASSPSAAGRSADAALSYSRTYMMWIHGPTVRSVRIVPARDLPSLIRRSVPHAVAANVNVSDLVRREGPRRRLALVVLYGTYNTLPPDEGVDIARDVVAVVDPQTRRVLLLNG